ncbi:MAG: SDR family oxidoreductase [Actinomycetota bacterium]
MSDALAPFRLDGKVAALTGAASGIGKATAELFGSVGAQLVLGDLDEAGAEATAASIRDAGGSAVSARCDITVKADSEALVARAVSEHGRLDVMGNIAGIPHNQMIVDVTEDELDKLLAINLKGPFFGVQAALAQMLTQDEGGSIINVASSGMDFAAPTLSVYAMTKAAVASLGRTAAIEGAHKKIRVNTIAPGATVTAFTEVSVRGEDGAVNEEALEGKIKMLQGASPMQMIGEADDQANLMLYLASDASKFATGQIWRCNGGAPMVW